MRDKLRELIERTIVLEFNLPYKDLLQVSISSRDDYCLKSKSDEDIVKVIYNSIVDYCLNESEIDITKLENHQLYALENRMRFDLEDDETTQLKYGFYGEVLLNIIIEFLLGTKKIIAKGCFYDVLNKREMTGYDCFHFLLNDQNNIEFWFGEAKMYSSLKSAINSIISNINKALSKKYLEQNVRAILNKSNDVDVTEISDYIISLSKKLKTERINLWNEIVSQSIEVVYPIIITYDGKNIGYEDLIAENLKIIEESIKKIDFKNEIDAKIMFILLPVNKVKEIKKGVLECIYQKELIE